MSLLMHSVSLILCRSAEGSVPPYAGIGSECLLYLQHVPIIALTYTFSPLLPGKVFCHARFAEFCFG